jgi:hypothetical protein
MHYLSQLTSFKAHYTVGVLSLVMALLGMIVVVVVVAV